MDIITSVLVGIGLAMDASAVSMAGGATARKGGVAKSALFAALFFGAFQGGMLLLGGIGGESLRAAVSDIDHWVAFGLLAIVGGKMILESSRICPDERVRLLDMGVLLMLSVATSIDALAVGVGVAFADHSLFETAASVAAITAALSFISVFAGNRYGCGLGSRAEVLGGLVLIGIGLNILYGHMAA